MEEPEPVDTVIFGEFVTLSEVSSDGAVMNFVMPGSTHSIVLTTSYEFNADKFAAGTRIFLNYRYADGSQDNAASGVVEVVNALNVDGAGAAPDEATSVETAAWRSDPVELSRAYMSGHYLNFVYSGYSVGTPKSRHFYLDPSTLDTPYPELHITFEGNLAGSDAAPYTVRGSYDMSALMADRDVEGVKIIYNRGSETIDFQRRSLTPAN